MNESEEKIKKYRKEYYLKNKEKIKQQQKAYREANIEKVRAREKARDAKRREEKKRYNAMYRVRKKQEKLLQQQQEELKTAQKILQEEELPNIQNVDVILKKPIIQTQPILEQSINKEIEKTKQISRSEAQKRADEKYRESEKGQQSQKQAYNKYKDSEKGKQARLKAVRAYRERQKAEELPILQNTEPIQQQIDLEEPQVFLENVEWLDILEEIRKEKANLYSLIQHELDVHYTISNKSIKFVVEDSINSYWHANAMSNYYLLKENIQFLKDIVKQKTGEDFEITVEYDNTKKNKQLESITRENLNSIRNIIIENVDNIIAPVENLKADYDNLKAEKENLKADYDNLKAEKENLKADYDNLKAEKENLKADYDNLKAEKEKNIKKNEVFVKLITETKKEYNELKKENQTLKKAKNQSNDNGIRPIKSEYGGILFRSKSEKRIAIYLDEIGAQWSYEQEGFKCINTDYKPDFYLPRVEDPYGNIINLWIEAKPGYNPSIEDIQKMKNFIYGNTSKIQNALLLIGQVPRQFKEIQNMFQRTKNESIPFYSLKMINGENIISCFVFQNKEGKTVLRKLDKKYPDIDYEKIREFFVNAHSENFENKDIF